MVSDNLSLASHDLLTKQSHSHTPIRVVLGKMLSASIVTAILVFLVLPTLLVVPLSLNDGSYLEFPPRGLTLRWYQAYFADADWMSATRFSLKIAILTATLSTLIGTMASLAISKSTLPGRGSLQALALGPMIVPHVVVGVALYLVFSPLRMTGTTVGFVLAHTVLAVPYVVIVVGAALQKLDTTLELAARSCGASRVQAFFLVELPIIAPSVAAAAVFSFLASFDDATVSFFISDIGGKSIGRKMFEDIDFNLTPIIAAASTVLIAISLVLMACAQRLTAKRSK